MHPGAAAVRQVHLGQEALLPAAEAGGNQGRVKTDGGLQFFRR